MPPRRVRLVGALAALLAFLLDQLSKQAILSTFSGDPAAHVPVAATGPVGFDLVLWWNRGISFGLLHLPNALMPYLLAGAAGLAAIGLGVWLWRSCDAWQGLALGLVIGGALGNALDRLNYGAVVDFLYFAWRDHYWPAFNLADSAICVGVALLILRSRQEGVGKAAETA